MNMVVEFSFELSVSSDVRNRCRMMDENAKLRQLFAENISSKTGTNHSHSKEHLEEQIQELRKQISKYEENEKRRAKFHDEIMDKIKTLLEKKKESFYWLSGMIADFMTIAEYEYQLALERTGNFLNHEKAIKINELRKEKKSLIKENKVLRYEIDYLKTLVPENYDLLEEYNETDEDYKSKDWIYSFISKDEYYKLPDIEKNKRALEYYLKRKKSKWEIGRDFEMYTGYLYEKQGYHVTYFGIEKKLHDMGRDLIVENGEVVKIVQCKYWSKEKTIHEKHIMQLLETTIKYRIDHPEEKRRIESVFVTHTTLSSVAQEFAKALDVYFIENAELGNYPVIKCNIKRDEYGKKIKIYHLPMDRQYDNTTINTKNGDFLAFSIEEAEDAGFRRI
jgi:hypothetical protein